MNKYDDLEPDEHGKYLGRVMQAYFKRLQRANEPDDLILSMDLLSAMERQLQLTAVGMVRSGQWSLARVAFALGISKQALAKWMNKR